MPNRNDKFDVRAPRFPKPFDVPLEHNSELFEVFRSLSGGLTAINRIFGTGFPKLGAGFLNWRTTTINFEKKY